MNCVDNTDICTKEANQLNMSTSTSDKQFTITILDIIPFDDSFGINYSINKSSNFSESCFSCKIFSKHLTKGEFEQSDWCGFNTQTPEHVNIAVSEGKGNYNVCINILCNETPYFSECQLLEYEPPTTAVDQSTSDTSETTSTTISLSAITTMPATPFTTSVLEMSTTSMLETSTSMSTTSMLETSTSASTTSTLETSTSASTTSTLETSTTAPTTLAPETSTTSWLSFEITESSVKTLFFTSSLPTEMSVDTTLPSMTTQLPTHFETVTPNAVVTESLSQSFPPSRSTGIYAKLPIAAFILLVILAVIILILIVIVLIKLVHLKKNKTSTYYVAKEEDNNYSQSTKRSSNLYSVNSVEDDKV